MSPFLQVAINRKENRMTIFDIVLLSVCGTLFVELSVLLIWWLKKGRKGFVMYNNYCAEQKLKESQKSSGSENSPPSV